MLNTFSPYVRMARHSKIIAPFQLQTRTIFDYELIYMEEGTFIVTMEGKDFVCPQGSILFIPPGVPHSFRIEGNNPVSQPHVHFDLVYDHYSKDIQISFKDYPDFTPEEQKMMRRNLLKGMLDFPIVRANDKELFQKQLYEMIDMYRSLDPLRSLKCKTLMLEMLCPLLKENGSSSLTQNYDLSADIKAYIDNNYTSILTLDILAAHFNYNKYYLEKCFSKKYGISIKKYYTSLRINAIENDLKKGYSVSEVSTKYHFTSIYAFSRFFKNSTGVAPSKFNEKDEKK